MRACVFIDGENFRHSIIELFSSEFKKDDYLPKKAKWGDLFDHFVVEGTRGEGKRLRAYWYVVQFIDYFPYKFPDPFVEMEKAKRLLSKCPVYRQDINSISDEISLKNKLKEIIGDLRKAKNLMEKRFNGWNAIHDGIAKSHQAIEFRRAGAINYNLFDKRLGNEKAVDVKLATDLILLNKIYDYAIIVSGDQDYVPAAQAVKDLGKKVINVAFLTRKGNLLPGGARRLNQITDWSLSVTYDELKTFLQL